MIQQGEAWEASSQPKHLIRTIMMRINLLTMENLLNGP